MLQVWTAQMAVARQIAKLNALGLTQADCLDITVKSAQGVGRCFAPSWQIVLDYKNGIITEEEYTKVYFQIINSAYNMAIENAFKVLLAKNKLVLLCYCKAGEFCHRILLKDELVKQGAEYMGEIR